MRYKIINTDKEYIYSTKDINKLYKYIKEILGYKITNNLDKAIKVLEKGHFYLITK